MNKIVRQKAADSGIPLMDYILKRISQLEQTDSVRRTVLAACPNSISVIKASLRAAKRWNCPVKFAATLNQVDVGKGYTGFTQEEFVKTIRQEARRINLNVPVIVAVDHGGPWLKDLHARGQWSYEDTFDSVKKSFEAAISAGYDLIHADPTIDLTLTGDQIIPIDTVAARTVELISHSEGFRRANGYDRIAYEVGTEEVHGGLADVGSFSRFLQLLKEGLKASSLEDVWPCFIVGKVGTDLHTTTFDPEMARRLSAIAREYGSVIKGHYTDGVTNPEAYPVSGMGAANVGPEFTEKEYEGLLELEGIENQLYNEGKVAVLSGIGQVLQDAVVESGRWKKWLQPGEDSANFDLLAADRREWLIRTGCRYIWQNSYVIAARRILYSNLEDQGIMAEEIVLSRIERSLNKYFAAFNLRDLNNLL